MSTLAKGNEVQIYVPLTSTMTITPGTGGTVTFGCSTPFGDAPAGRTVYAAENIDIPNGSTVFMRANVADATYDGDVSLTTPGGGVVALSEASPYYSAAGANTYLAASGACEVAGWYTSVAAGNITIYDALTATGTPIVPATALVAGPMPIMGAGTNGKIIFATGCTVVLSGAATVRVLVQ